MSGGKLNLIVDMPPVYQATNTQYCYSQNDSNLKGLMSEIFSYYKNMGYVNDYSDYDSDGDGCIDCLIFTWEYATSEPIQDSGQQVWGFYGSGAATMFHMTVNDETINAHLAKVPFLTPQDKKSYLADTRYQYIHECNHLMGLDDNYSAYGFECTLYGTNDIMVGEHYYINGYYRYLLDWIEPKILPYEDSTEEIDLCAFENNNTTNKEQAIILIPDSSKLPVSEYYIVEYRQDLQRESIYGSIISNHLNGGVIIWHVNAERDVRYNKDYGYVNSSNYIKPVYKNGGRVSEGNALGETGVQEGDIFLQKMMNIL